MYYYTVLKQYNMEPTESHQQPEVPVDAPACSSCSSGCAVCCSPPSLVRQTNDPRLPTVSE